MDRARRASEISEEQNEERLRKRRERYHASKGAAADRLERRNDRKGVADRHERRNALDRD